MRPVDAGPTAPVRTTDKIRPVFDHLDALTDERGLFEHAQLATPRVEHGYCVDDVARALVVTSQEPHPAPVVQRLHEGYLAFVLSALSPDGACHNRMDPQGRWADEPGLGDWWGRALWSLGVAAASSPTAGRRARALAGFRIAAQRRSPDHRASAFAALGAAELLRVRPAEPAARALLEHIAHTLGRQPAAPGWVWPEPRLTYANATLAEALLVAGSGLPDDAVLARGLELLTFLMRTEVQDGRLSVTPVAGRGPGEIGGGFDQQPIEVAAIAQACATAHRITQDPAWLAGVELAQRWFLGDNDAGAIMVDLATGAGFDGLEPAGRNENQGAESTLALLATAQLARQAAELR